MGDGRYRGAAAVLGRDRQGTTVVHHRQVDLCGWFLPGFVYRLKRIITYRSSNVGSPVYRAGRVLLVTSVTTAVVPASVPAQIASVTPKIATLYRTIMPSTQIGGAIFSNGRRCPLVSVRARGGNSPVNARRA